MSRREANSDGGLNCRGGYMPRLLRLEKGATNSWGGKSPSSRRKAALTVSEAAC